MKKLLLCAVAIAMLLGGVATPLDAEEAEEVDECPCGADDMGTCLPCEETGE
jgi:hypothetical protein